MINSKEKLNKKNKVGAAFTDDGFAMGSLDGFFTCSREQKYPKRCISDVLIVQTMMSTTFGLALPDIKHYLT